MNHHSYLMLSLFFLYPASLLAVRVVHRLLAG